MVDNVPQNLKKSPVNMVAGAGDTGETQAPHRGIGPRQSVPNGSIPIAAFSTIWSGSPLRGLPRFRNSWRDRWPEYFSACWMTFILLGISFLIFYIAGLVIYRQQTFMVFKCNNTTDTSMYYHKIVDDHVHFSFYSEFLSTQAMKYPKVRHYIYFLFDDSNRDRLRRTLFGKAIPNKGNVINTREIKMFQRRFRNTNITVMSLNKFFVKSPMKDIWMSVPSTYLSFYARLYSIWEKGGIAIDLDTYNINYGNNVNNLEYYIKDYQKKNQHIQHHEKEKSKALNHYMTNGAMYVSYTFLRINDDEFSNNMTEHEGKNNSTKIVEKPEANAITTNETKTVIFTNNTSNNTLGEFHNSIKEFTVTDKNINETITLPISDTPKNISNKIADNNIQELSGDGNKSGTANNTKDENIEALQNPIEIMVMTGDTKKIVSFEDLFSQPDGFSQQLEISVSGPYYEGPPFFNIQSETAAFPVLAIESSGTFIATAAPHHKLLEGIMNFKCRWLRPKYLIQSIMNNKCSPELYDREVCSHTFIY